MERKIEWLDILNLKSGFCQERKVQDKSDYAKVVGDRGFEPLTSTV